MNRYKESAVYTLSIVLAVLINRYVLLPYCLPGRPIPQDYIEIGNWLGACFMVLNLLHLLFELVLDKLDRNGK